MAINFGINSLFTKPVAEKLFHLRTDKDSVKASKEFIAFLRNRIKELPTDDFKI